MARPKIHRIGVLPVGHLNKIGDLGGVAIYDEIVALWQIDQGDFHWVTLSFDGVDVAGPRNLAALNAVDLAKGMFRLSTNIGGVRYASLIHHEIKH